MDVVIRKSTEDAVNFAARLLADAIKCKPDIVLGLATGRTMENLYGRLVTMHKNDKLDFSLARSFNLDEYVGLPAEHPGSYRFYMSRYLHNHVNIDKRNTFLPNGMAEDLAAECCAYEKRIKSVGGIDLQLLGIGRSGHIGFNEPLSALPSRPRPVVLPATTIAENSPLFDNPADMPRRAITMGVGTIMDCRRLILLATGESKAEIIAKAVEGPVSSRVTASVVQLHQNCTVICDEAAASQLEEREYCQWVFDNDPMWDPYR